MTILIGESGWETVHLYSQRRDEVVHESGGLRYRIGNGRTGPIRRYPEAFRDCPLHLLFC